MSLDSTLAGLDTWLAAHYPVLHDSLQPGLSETAIDAALTGWPHRLSDDVRALYRWHDGCEDTQLELLPGLGFLPLAEAHALAGALWAASAVQVERGGPDFFPAQLFPVFSDGDNDRMLLVQGADAAAPNSPAQVIALQQGQRLYAFERLQDLLAAALDLFGRGVYRVDQQRDRVEVTDEAAARATWRRYPLLYLEGVDVPELAGPEDDEDEGPELDDEARSEALMSGLLGMLGLDPDSLDPATASLDELTDLAEMLPPEQWPEPLQMRFRELKKASDAQPAPPTEDTP